MEKQRGNAGIGMIVGIVAVLAWFTHVIVCLGAGKWGFLVAGALFFPIGIVHGFGVWFGFW